MPQEDRPPGPAEGLDGGGSEKEKNLNGMEIPGLSTWM